MEPPSKRSSGRRKGATCCKPRRSRRNSLAMHLADGDSAGSASSVRPNPSIERTATGKPVSVAHVKRLGITRYKARDIWQPQKNSGEVRSRAKRLSSLLQKELRSFAALL